MNCVTCAAERPAHLLYRCFDCKAHICEQCVPGHFNNRHEPHPMHVRELHQALAPWALMALESRDAWKRQDGSCRELGVPDEAEALIPSISQGQLNKLEALYERLEKMLTPQERAALMSPADTTATKA